MTSRSRGAMLQATATDGRGAETDLGRLVSKRKEAQAKRSALLQSQYERLGSPPVPQAVSSQTRTLVENDAIERKAAAAKKAAKAAAAMYERRMAVSERPVARRQMDTQQAPTNELFQRMPAYEAKLVAHPAAEQANLLALLRHPMTVNLARRRAETQSRRAQQHSHRA